MNSEKVKEIKKGLECCTNPVYCEQECPYHIYERHLECINELAKDSLTLINELESENERLSKELDSEWKDRRKAEEDLHKAQWNYKIGLKQSQSANKKLKDRIAELEKQMCRNEDLHTATEKLNDTIILKQFAERLKEISCEMYLKEQLHRCIDEILKEFINKGE